MDNIGFWITPDCLAMFDDLQWERQKTLAPGLKLGL
jgi:hypothetical protein